MVTVYLVDKTYRLRLYFYYKSCKKLSEKEEKTVRKISQVKYNKMHCTRCGKFTAADLAGFNFSQIFAKSLVNNDVYQVLARLDLKFYYTLRDLCQELSFQKKNNAMSVLNLTVGHVIKQIEFLMRPVTFQEILQSDRNTLLYNNLFTAIYSNHENFEEKMQDIELLIDTLSRHQSDEIITSVPIEIIFDYDDLNNEIPVGIRYCVNDQIHEEYQRICPNCGSVFDRQSGYHHEFIIAMVGLGNSGKTTYLTALIDQLAKNIDGAVISITGGNCQAVFKDNLDNYHLKKAVKRTTIDKMPLVYLSVKVNDKEFNFVFVDVPGDIYNFQNDAGADFINEKCQILKNADLIYCCVEPAMISSKYHNFHWQHQDSYEGLANLANNLNLIFSNKIPAAIILTQCDLLQESYPDIYLPEIAVLEEDFILDGKLNLTNVKVQQEKVWQYFKNMNSFTATIDDLFAGYAFFGVSSYGFDVTDPAVVNKTLNPSLVELPFIWTLAVLGCIDSYEMDISKNVFKKEIERFNLVTDRSRLYFKEQ